MNVDLEHRVQRAWEARGRALYAADKAANATAKRKALPLAEATAKIAWRILAFSIFGGRCAT